MTVPGYLTELQQALRLPLKAFSHDGVIFLSGDVLVEVAVGTPPEAVGPLQRTGRKEKVTRIKLSEHGLD